MNYIDSLMEQLNMVYTENGDKAFQNSGSYCLDFYYLIGGMRGDYKKIIPLFTKAFFENKILALKILFYTRDIYNGLGERNSFRFILNYLGNLYPEIALQLVEFIPVYGRYDDLFVLLSTPIRQNIIDYIKHQLDTDLENKENGKPISLLAKWMPSINTSSESTRKIALDICNGLGISSEKYRKMLSYLRKGIILENDLREKNYSFEYSKVPANAFHKYIDAFSRNDKERFSSFIADCEKCADKINTNTLYPYKVIKSCIDFPDNLSLEERQLKKKTLDSIWKSFNRDEFCTNAIVVRDGSGSMMTNYLNSVTPNEVATSIAILLSEQLSGPFKNKFITFSEDPKLIEIKDQPIYDTVHYIMNYCEASNTNISKVYSLLLRTALSNRVKNKDMIKKVIIISDMEFDGCVTGRSTFESFKEKYEKSGYDFPEIVFWNVNSRHGTIPVMMNEKNVKLVSGASDKIIEMVMKGVSKTPMDFMLESLGKYSEIEKIQIKE